MSTNEWLKRRFRSVAASVPASKRVKFSDLLEEARRELTPTITNYALAQAIRDEFPAAVTRKVGASRHSYVDGLEKVDDHDDSMAEN